MMKDLDKMELTENFAITQKLGKDVSTIGLFNDGGNAWRRFFEILDNGYQAKGSQVFLIASNKDRVGQVPVVLAVGDKAEITFNRHWTSVVGTVRTTL